MITLKIYRKLSMELSGTVEQIHSGMPAFAVGKKRFAIFDPKKGELALKIPLTDPVRVEGMAQGVLVPAPGKYGAQGWAGVDMENIKETEFAKLLKIAHDGVAIGA